MTLRIDHITFGYHESPVLKDISFEISPAEVLCMVGPNGSGKSTLIRCLDAIIRPQKGRIYINGKDIRKLHRQELARCIAYVPQGTQQTFATTVFDTVLMGRRPHACWRSNEKDTDKVIEVLQLLGLDKLAMRDYGELSGGQQQRVMIARALAQEPDILLMDESTSALDISHQLEVMETLAALVRSRNIATVMAIHDLNMASRYADRILMLKDGNIVIEGTPADIFTVENIATVYGVDASISLDDKGKPFIIPVRRVMHQTDSETVLSRQH